LPVGTDSALLNLPGSIETRIPVDKDHSSITKFNSKQDRTYRSVLSRMLDFLDDGSLREAGYDPQHSARSATNALRPAVAGGDVRLLRLLLQRGGDPNFLSGTETTPILCMAIETPSTSRAEMVHLLLDHGSNIQVTDNDGRSPLHAAAQIPRGEAIVRLLLDRGADIEAKSNSRNTPLHSAVSTVGNQATVRLLLDRGGADIIEAKNSEDISPLHIAAWTAGNEAIVRLLLDSGADIEAKNSEDISPLHMAAWAAGNEATVRLLLDRGADIKGRNNYGNTPLHWAASKTGNEATVRLLLERGADR
jgi:ankyrin repeat protein